VSEFLGRDRYQRDPDAGPGYRNGHQPVEVKTTGHQPRSNTAKLDDSEELDAGWPGMAGGNVSGPFDAVGVVAGSFDGARVGAMPALGVWAFKDFGRGFLGGVSQSLRGKRPPGR
jgi:hypothetical protein